MKKAAAILGFALALLFVILGICSSAPDKYIKSYGEGKMYEYVGGDAYNFIIEASLRGGEIAGAITARAIYFAAAGILAVISLVLISPDEEKKELSGILSTFRYNTESALNAIKDMLFSHSAKAVQPKAEIPKQATEPPKETTEEET